MVRTGIMRAYGADLRRLIGLGMQGAGAMQRVVAFGVGLGVTGLLQSSTATALMTASFAERGLLATAPALAVMLGADVGTSVVAQALSVDLRWLSPLLIVAGVATFMTATVTRWRDLGRAVIGLGLMLLALQLIVAASAPLRGSEILPEVLSVLARERVLALLFAAGLTWLAHSSLAIVLLVMSLADAGLLPPGLTLVLVLGANLGGGLPAVVATWRGDTGARRLTLGNLAFRATGVAAVLPFTGLAMSAVALFDPDPGRQVVNFHAAFNVLLALVFLPAVGAVARLVERALPDRPAADDPAKPRYLDPTVAETPVLGIAAAARETLRMGDAIESMLRDALTVLETDDRHLADEVEKRDDVIDGLHEAIKLCLMRITREPLEEADIRRCMEIFTFMTNLEHVGDIIDKDLMELAAKKMKHRLKFSPEGWAEIVNLHGQLTATLKLALGVFMSGELRMARRLLAEKVAFRERERVASERHLDRLRTGRVESIETSSLHLDILRDLKRINSHLTAIAYPILDQAGELRESRLRQASG